VWIFQSHFHLYYVVLRVIFFSGNTFQTKTIPRNFEEEWNYYYVIVIGCGQQLISHPSPRWRVLQGTLLTSQVAGLEDQDYWARLKSLRLFSQERRKKRYRIILIWKVLQGYFHGYSFRHCRIQEWRGWWLLQTILLMPHHL
jgi:hypothetical protein